MLLVTGGLDGKVVAWRIDDDLLSSEVQEEQEEEDETVDILASKDVAWLSRLPTDASTKRRWNANALSARQTKSETGEDQVLITVAVAGESPDCAGHVVVYTLSVYGV